MNPKKVVIVDDEFLIRELLAEKIDWNGLGCEIMLKASSASEVYDYIDENEVDLIVTDINMPYIDGIQMSKKIKNDYPRIKIIVLTGYNEFEYAKSAIDIGVEAFIVKPIDKEEVEPVVRKTVGLIDDELKLEMELFQMRQHMEEERIYLKEKFFFDLLKGHMEEEQIMGSAERYGIENHASGYRIAVVQPSVPGKDLDLTVYQCKRFLLSYFDHDRDHAVQESDHIHVFTDSSAFVRVFFTSASIKIYDELNYCLKVMEKELGMEVKIGISDLKTHIGYLPEADLEAKNCLKHILFDDALSICSYDEFSLEVPEKFDSVTTRHYVDQQINELQFFLKSGLKSEMEATLQGLYDAFKKLLSNGDYTAPTYLRIQMARIISTIQQTVLGLGTETKEALEQDKEYMKLNNFAGISSVNTLNELQQWIDGYCQAILRQVKMTLRKKDENIIDAINAYMLENIGNSELSQKGTAEKFFLNPSYLSRMYKKQMGVSFKERLFKLRMEEAVELLKTTDMKVYEIGSQVGIEDPNYFSLCFKKFMNMSVSEYRKQLAEK